MIRPLNSQRPIGLLNQLPRFGSWAVWELGVVICFLAMVVSGCDGRREPPPRSPALPPVVLPDLSQMDQAVQDQIGASYQSLSSSRDNRTTPPGDLARAYGETGKLLMAAEYFETAEPFIPRASPFAWSIQFDWIVPSGCRTRRRRQTPNYNTRGGCPGAPVDA